MTFTRFSGDEQTHTLTHGRTDPKQNASGTVDIRWRRHKRIFLDHVRYG